MAIAQVQHSDISIEMIRQVINKGHSHMLITEGYCVKIIMKETRELMEMAPTFNRLLFCTKHSLLYGIYRA